MRGGRRWRTGKAVAVSGRARRDRNGSSVESSGTLGHRLRARRSHRRSAALRHSRVQDGKMSSTGAPNIMPKKGSCSAPTRTSGRMCPSKNCTTNLMPSFWPAAQRHPEILPVVPWPRAEGASTSRWNISRSRTSAARATTFPTLNSLRPGNIKRVVIIGGGDTGAGLSGDGSPSGRQVDRAIRIAAQTACGTRGGQPVAELAEHLPHLVRARRRRRPRILRSHEELHARTAVRLQLHAVHVEFEDATT